MESFSDDSDHSNSSLPHSAWLLKRVPAALWTTDTSLRFTAMAGAGLSSMKAGREDFVGAHLTDLFPQSGAEVTPLAAHQRALEGHVSRFDVEIMGRAMQVHLEPLQAAEGNIVGVIGVALDNTDRRVAEMALRISEQSCRSLIEDAPYAICRLTARGQLLQVNCAMVEMLGYESEAELLLGSMREEIFAEPCDCDHFLEGLRETGSLHGFESTWRRQVGQTMFVSLGGRAVRDSAGHISHFDILAENITERKQLEDQLRQAQKMQAVGQLAGGVAHDFNNLLTVIKGQVEVVLSGMAAGDPFRPRLQEVEKAAERAATLTRQLLAFGRTQVVQGRLLNLNNVVTAMTQMLARLIGEGIDLTFTPEENLEHVQADAGQIEQVLMNLVLNAKDAMPEGGRLTISTHNVTLDAFSRREFPIAETGAYVSLAVSDTGHGMRAETQARMYEPFFTTKKVGEGTGLGLFTVYAIAKQSKGYIHVESEPGKGTTFTFYLPRVAGSPDMTPPASPVAARGGTETILLAEDEEAIRKLTSSFLAKLGYQVLSAANGEEARRIARANEGGIDLLLSDAVMPKVGGNELAKDLRLTFPRLKVILMSGYAGDSTAQDAINELDAVFVQKPFSSMQFLAMKIREVLDGGGKRSAERLPVGG